MAAEKSAQIQNFAGLVSAPFTAFGQDGQVNVDNIPEYVDHLISQGVKGVFVNGTTGEGLSLNVAERKATAEAWITHGKTRFDLIVIQIGAESIRDAQELASHAEEIGATGIACLPPLFFKPPTDEHLVEYYKQVAGAAPNLPFMLYHIPSFTGVQISFREFLPKISKAVPTFVGGKFTSYDINDLLQILSIPGKPFKIFSGFDEVLLPSLSCGVTGAVGGTYSFMTPVALRILDAFERGNIEEAQQYQNKVIDALEKIGRHGQRIACLKATMNLLGPLDFGQPRAPLLPLDTQALSNLKEDLKNLNAEEWRNMRIRGEMGI